MESVVLEQMYEIPSDETVASCTITRETVEEGADPIRTYHEEPAPKKPVPRKKKKKNTDEIA